MKFPVKQNFCKLFSLFLSMLKVGLFTFGGGYAMIALLENELFKTFSYFS